MDQRPSGSTVHDVVSGRSISRQLFPRRSWNERLWQHERHPEKEKPQQRRRRRYLAISSSDMRVLLFSIDL